MLLALPIGGFVAGFVCNKVGAFGSDNSLADAGTAGLILGGFLFMPGLLAEARLCFLCPPMFVSCVRPWTMSRFRWAAGVKQVMCDRPALF